MNGDAIVEHEANRVEDVPPPVEDIDPPVEDVAPIENHYTEEEEVRYCKDTAMPSGVCNSHRLFWLLSSLFQATGSLIIETSFLHGSADVYVSGCSD